LEYVLVSVNKQEEIITRVSLAENVGINGAKTYFQGVKQMSDRTAFDKLWVVMTETEFNRIKTNNETRSHYEEFGSWLDMEKS
jgi:hypothetical protein|tara:strand:- start:3156 stop:3404 length:249 start_codon:yes stop_codon:yes gene_type:complete